MNSQAYWGESGKYLLTHPQAQCKHIVHMYDGWTSCLMALRKLCLLKFAHAVSQVESMFKPTNSTFSTPSVPDLLSFMLFYIDICWWGRWLIARWQHNKVIMLLLWGDWTVLSCHNVQNIIEKWSLNPSIISVQLRSWPAESISIPDGGTSFSLTCFCTFFIFLGFQRHSLLHWQNICGFILRKASMHALCVSLE